MEWVDEGMIEGHWGSAGSGLLLTTGTRILLLLRSGQVREPFTWGYPGGAIPRDWETGERKNALISAHTETEEELGEGVPRYTVIAEHINDFPDGFRYTTYIGRVKATDAETLNPPLNWESDDWMWARPEDLVGLDLHPGVEWILERAWDQLYDVPRGSKADAGDWTPKLTKRKKGVAERKLAKAVVTNPALGWALLRMDPEPLLVIHVLGIRRSDPAEPWLAYVAIWPPSSSLGGAEPCLVTCEAYKAYKRIQGRLRPRVDKRSMIQPGVRGGMWRGWNVWLAPISLAVAQEVGLDT
jgi:hypothetical protein